MRINGGGGQVTGLGGGGYPLAFKNSVKKIKTDMKKFMHEMFNVNFPDIIEIVLIYI